MELIKIIKMPVRTKSVNVEELIETLSQLKNEGIKETYISWKNNTIYLCTHNNYQENIQYVPYPEVIKTNPLIKSVTKNYLGEQ